MANKKLKKIKTSGLENLNRFNILRIHNVYSEINKFYLKKIYK